MIKCRLINTCQPLHLSQFSDKRYNTVASNFYIDKAKEGSGDFIGVFRLDPIITPTKAYGDFIIMKLQTPSISPTPGLLSLEYDMIEDFLKDWEILGIYDIFEHHEDIKTNSDRFESLYGNTKDLKQKYLGNKENDNIIDI